MTLIILDKISEQNDSAIYCGHTFNVMTLSVWNWCLERHVNNNAYRKLQYLVV